MRFLDLIHTGLQNLWRRRLRSVLTIVAVLIGSTSVVAMLILAFGARNVFMAQLEATGMLTRITIVSDKEADADFFGGGGMDDEDGTKLTEEILEEIGQRNHITAVTPVVSANAFQSAQIKDGNGKKVGMHVQGLRPNPEFDPIIAAGRNFADNESENGNIILGSRYLKKLGFEDPNDAVGETIIFTTWEGYYNIDMELPPYDTSDEEVWQQRQEIPATIIGVTQSGPSDGESRITEGWARRLNTNKHYGPSSEESMLEAEEYNRKLGEEAGWTGREIQDDEWMQPESSIEVRDETEERGFESIYAQVDSAEHVEDVAAGIEESLDVGAITAKEFLDGFLSVFTVITIVLAAIGGISLLVAAVGIINTMVMAVMERTKEIGIMKAVGASKGSIRWMFTFEAALLGFWGGVAGVGLGYGLTLVANYFVNQQLSGGGFDAQNVAQLEWWLALSVIGFTTIIGVIAGLYPASRAARLDPVDALRRE